ncbi:hypothetical protein O6H91_01G058300 [Diphasiastrum complanatum]|nr:hypothetical protein O6H91_01G058300 [Diphasiastrum complanatum]
MSAARDPFYLVKEEIQDSVNKVQAAFGRWEQLLSSHERSNLGKEVVTGCESIEWQVDELDRAIAVAAKDPARFSIDTTELDKRRTWTNSTRIKIYSLRMAVQNWMDKAQAQGQSASRGNTRRELLRMPNDGPGPKPNQAIMHENEDYLTSQSDTQALIMKEQDQELDELSETVERLGGVGLTIHEELAGQDKILEDLGKDMDGTSSRLDFIQRRVAYVIKKAGAKGQIFLIIFLVVLLLILVLLVFYT